MADASVPRGSADASWGPSTSVRSASAHQAPAPASARPAATRREPDWGTSYPAPSVSRTPARERLEATGRASRERGLPGWAALLLLIGITTLGIIFDALRGHQLGVGFNVGIIAGSIVAILVVRRSGMFPVVVAPPIVYSLGAGISLYLRSSGLHDRGVLIDAATNWLVYGFPAIAAATASVLIIAGIRLIIRR